MAYDAISRGLNNKNGQAVASSEFHGLAIRRLDEWPGQAHAYRTFISMLDMKMDLSTSRLAIAARSEIPTWGHWNADVVSIDNARVYHQGGQPVRYDLPSTLTEDQRNGHCSAKYHLEQRASTQQS